MIRQNVSLGVALNPIERAERAELFADVRVIDIAINDVADDVVRLQSLPDAIGTGCQVQKFSLFKEANGFVRSYSDTIHCRFQYRFDASHANCRLRTDLIAPTLAAFS